jgi:hypothetical protein
MHPANSSDVFTLGASSKLDGTGKLTDMMFGDGISKPLLALQEWTIRLRET